MGQIKRRYWVVMGVLLLIFLLSLTLIVSRSDKKIEHSLEVVGLTIALFTGVSALALGDKGRPKIDYAVRYWGNATKGKGEIWWEQLGPDVKAVIGEQVDKINTYQVYFKITNTSPFSLESPTLTFRIPKKVQHPTQDYQHLEIRSNLYNSGKDARHMEFGNTILLSHSNLPFLNENEDLKIWIRMRLKDDDDKPITIRLSLNANNADGSQKIITVTPRDLLVFTENESGVA